MAYYPEKVQKLIEKLTRFPGIGPKSAERILNYLLEESDEAVSLLAENLLSLKKEVKLCERCFNLSDKSICSICSDESREGILCVVEEVSDLVVIEKTGFKGRYHVLGGSISPLDRVSSAHLKIPQLIARLKNEPITEVIIATNPTTEGENTSAYISGLLKKLNISHSRLACGLPVGSEIEYVGVQTLQKSIEGRKPL